MEISSVPTDVNKIGAPSVTTVEMEGPSKPQIAPVKESFESSSSSLNDQALHGRGREDEKRQSGEPMKREDILSEILKMRQVKKSTVMINLNNFFVRNSKNEYTIKK